MALRSARCCTLRTPKSAHGLAHLRIGRGSAERDNTLITQASFGALAACFQLGVPVAHSRGEDEMSMQSPQTGMQKDGPSRRGVNIMARTLFRQMKEQGYSQDQIIGLSSELLQLVHHEVTEQAVLEAAE